MENKLKILILNYEYPPLGGGAGVVTRYHAEELSKIGYEITVVTCWFSGELEYIKNDNLTIIKLKSKRKHTFKSNPIEMLSWIFTTKKYFSKKGTNHDFDLCLAHFSIPGGVVAKYLYKKYKIPYFVISHGHDIPFFSPKQMLKYHIVTYFWVKSIIKKASKLILLTSEMKQNADNFLGKSLKHKNVVIPNGCKTDFFKPDFSKKSKTFKIVFIGRLVWQKDPLTFLKAIKLIANKITNFEVIILGDGNLREEMESFVKKNNLTPKVSFKGWITKDEMIKHYQSAIIQVISSRDEAMSIAALEALSCGLFVISTPVSGNTEIIQEGINGLFFEIGNEIDLSEKIIKIYNKYKSNNMEIPSDILFKFREKYSWEKIAQQYKELITNH